MKIKSSLIRKILLGIIDTLEFVHNKLIKIKNSKKGNKKKSLKSVSKLINSYTKQIDKLGVKSKLSNKIIITSIDQLDFYVDNCNGTVIKLEEAIKIASKEVKQLKDELSNKTDKIIDEYMDRKFIIDNMIKNVYFKAKQLVITISGALLRINEDYRKTIDKFLDIRNTILNKSYEVMKENKFLLKFVIDNNIDNDKKFDECAEILTKMYITEKDQSLYNSLVKYTNIFNSQNNLQYI